MAPKKSSDDSDDESEDTLELNIELDPDGRPEGVSGDVQYGFRSFDHLLDLDEHQLAAVRRACARAFTARATKGGYSTGATYWLGAKEMRAGGGKLQPLERLARHIFELHTANSSFDEERSGAEWWTQYISAEDSIGWHWDRDYALEADHGISVHPAIATVTYFSDVGAPTLVFENAAPVLASDEPPSGARAFHASWPRAGKHIAFDGRWLHGAPDGVPAAPLRASDGAATARRATFLVNVWLNHKPIASERAPRSCARTLASELDLRWHGRAALPRPLRLHAMAKRPRVPPASGLCLVLEPAHVQLARGPAAVDEVPVGSHEEAPSPSRAGGQHGALRPCAWKVFTDDARRPLLISARLPLERLRTIAHGRAGGASNASLLLGEGDFSLTRASAPRGKRAKARAGASGP